MTKIYKITFKPVEPYFFGNEKSFIFPGQNQSSVYSGSYFIRSEKIPSQSTVLGALRYIFLPYKWADFSPSDTEKIIADKQTANNETVGVASFDIASENVQDFGIIKKISPIFVCGVNTFGESITLIHTPMDHNQADDMDEETKKKNGNKRDKYSPFDEYFSVMTSEGSKLYAKDFDVKKSLAHSWVALENSEIYTEAELFESDLRIGINRQKDKDGFFKKEYCMLRKNFVFAVYAELDVTELPQSNCVFLGQGKSAFNVTFEEKPDLLKQTVEDFLGKYKRAELEQEFIYCLSDCFISNFDNKDVLFCAIDTKDYRAFKTLKNGRIEKGGILYRQLKAGSIIVSKNPDEWINKNKMANAEKLGFNAFVKLGGK